MAQKFLIVNDKFVFSYSIKYHRELMPDKATAEDVDGGGWFYLDRPNKKIYLFSKSEEFGIAPRADILNALKRTLFPSYMDGVKFYISYHEDLKEAMKQEQEDWIYDDSSELLVDDYTPVNSSIHELRAIDNSIQFHTYGMKNREKQNQIKQTPVRNDSKIGRYDKCKCGSGKKYKQCCLTK